MQGTVKSFDPATHRCVLLDDSLRVIEADGDAFANSGLRELRVGQRVRFELVGAGNQARVRNLGIVSL